MTDIFIEIIQMIGALFAVGLGTAAVVTYIAIWPFDRHLRAAQV